MDLEGEEIGNYVIVDLEVFLWALVFKIMDDCFGVLIFIWIYFGIFSKGDIIFNIVIGKIECIGCLVEMYVDFWEEIEFV